MTSPTNYSLTLTRKISDAINNQTFHHHYHILFDIAATYPDEYLLNYLEIGCYAGGSACLLLHRPNTDVTSIDLGIPIDENIVKHNIDSLNLHNNNFRYIKGNSKEKSTYSRVSDKLYDIIFIDGDHSYSGVISDFEMYSTLIKENGYIIFDDYNDSKYSPQVKLAVDFIISNLTEYEVIGTIPNLLGARPIELTEGNLFILRKI